MLSTCGYGGYDTTCRRGGYRNPKSSELVESR
jgi:hypothetical protein